MNADDAAILAEAKQMLRDDRIQDAIVVLTALAERLPSDAAVRFHLANSLDISDREAEAVQHYRRALELGLPPDLRLRALIQLGSSLRVTGDVAAAVQEHLQASREYPSSAANRIFLALALHSAGQHGAAVRELGMMVLAEIDNSDLAGYRVALETYLRNLAQNEAGRDLSV
jgi:thioredoxin-like negative regulator of GroEL